MASWTKDPDLVTVFHDNSIRKFNDPVVSSKCSQLYAGFSSYGPPNITQQLNSNSSFLNKYGDDVTLVEKYGYAGLYASHALQGGAEVWFCRLLPEDAKRATIMLSVYIKEDDAIPIYERNIDNSFVLDEEGNKIPIMIDDPDAAEDEDPKPQIQKTVKGYRIKWVAEESLDEDNPDDVPMNVIIQDGWTKYPLLYFQSTYKGSTGNKFGLKLTNNYTDDQNKDDGRRYMLYLYLINSSGVIEQFDQRYDFALNPDALVSKYAELPEGFNYIYQNYDTNNSYQNKEIRKKYSSKNYLALLNQLKTRFSDGDLLDIDILTATDMYGVEYDEIVIDEASLDFDESVVFLEGGHDGSLQLGNTVKGIEGDIIVDEAHIETTKIDLIKKYYTGQIDDRLESCQKIPAGIIVDCNYSVELKKVIADVVSVRNDMVILFDCGITKNFNECEKIINVINGIIDSANFNYAIFPHCGIPVDTPKNGDIKVTQNYETAYKLPKIYKTFSAFCVYAGYERGIVDTFIPDWYISNNTLKKNAQKYSINYITDYGKVGGSTSTGIPPLWVDADKTLYYEKNSVMKSLRNAIVGSDLIRMGATILSKYRHGNSAESDMQKAGEELTNMINLRYPPEFKFEPTIYQTEKDKVEGNACAYIIMRPPNTIGKWRLEIEANRQE